MASPDRERDRRIMLRRVRQSAARRARKEHRDRSCTGKTCFINQERASLAAQKMSVQYGEDFNEYKCEHCWAWHVGHVPPWKEIENAAKRHECGGKDTV